MRRGLARFRLPGCGDRIAVEVGVAPDPPLEVIDPADFRAVKATSCRNCI
jgi:hypothetical protein